jgi:hypothetical protein
VAKTGKMLGSTEDEEVFRQKEAFGDVMVSVTGGLGGFGWLALAPSPGTQISVDKLLWEVLQPAGFPAPLQGGKPRAFSDDAQICFIFDMCRFTRQLTFSENMID